MMIQGPDGTCEIVSGIISPVSSPLSTVKTVFSMAFAPANGSDRPPLAGQTVLITRPAGQAGLFASLLHDAGAATVLGPAIEILPPADWKNVDAAIDAIQKYRLIVFVSRNSVQHFMDRVIETNQLPAAQTARYAAIGSSTAAAVEAAGLPLTLMPKVAVGSSMAAAIIDFLNESSAGANSPARVLLLRASRGSDEIPTRLTAVGIHVDSVVAYRSVDASAFSVSVIEKIEASEIGWVTVTSSAIARATGRLLSEQVSPAALAKLKVASISPATSDAAQEAGLNVVAVAKTPGLGTLIDAIVAAKS